MADKGRKPELLAPAGDMERLKMAVLYGADAVYLAGTDFGMRAFAGNFTPEELPQAVAYAHEHGVRVHCTVNTMPRNEEIARLPEHLERLNDAGVDALIAADLGTFTLAGRYAPRCQRHVSTQASVCNYETARAKAPASLELEAFVHGAMCVSYSGRCLLSNYMTGRDSSRGACAQPCRYHYALMEEKRPGEYFPVEEDGQGAYILNSRDMCMIDHLEDLCQAGPSPPITPLLSPGPTATVWTRRRQGGPRTPSGGTRWNMSATVPTPPGFTMGPRGSTMRTPATFGSGR